MAERLHVPAQASMLAHAPTHYIRPSGWTDGLGASAPTHMHTCSFYLCKLNSPSNPPSPSPPRRGACPLASRRLCRTPAKRRPPVRLASPPPRTIPAPINGACTHARSPLIIRPPAVSPATLPHACQPVAPPVSWQHVAPPCVGPRHPHALRPPLPSHTAVARAPVHVELAPRRREAVTASGRRWEGGKEIFPGPGGRIVHVEVVEIPCAGRAGGATAARRLLAGRAARLHTHAWLAAAACAAAEYPAPSRRLK
jgi:hypothetical protein